MKPTALVPLALLVLAIALSATAAAAAPGKASRVETPADERRLDAEARTEADEASPLGSLLHAAPDHVRARLGDPDVARSEGRGGFWTYRLPHCALFLFFHETARGLRVSGAATGPRKRGEPVPTVAACLASAITADTARPDTP